MTSFESGAGGGTAETHHREEEAEEGEEEGKKNDGKKEDGDGEEDGSLGEVDLWLISLKANKLWTSSSQITAVEVVSNKTEKTEE